MAGSLIAAASTQAPVIAVAAVVGVARRIVPAVTPVADPVHTRDRGTPAIGMCIDLTHAVRCRLGDDMSAIATTHVPPDV